jgi:hypothetical protein
VGNFVGIGFFTVSKSGGGDDMVNGFPEMDARFPTHELPYLTENQKSTYQSLTIALNPDLLGTNNIVQDLTPSPFLTRQPYQLEQLTGVSLWPKKGGLAKGVTEEIRYAVPGNSRQGLERTYAHSPRSDLLLPAK